LTKEDDRPVREIKGNNVSERRLLIIDHRLDLTTHFEGNFHDPRAVSGEGAQVLEMLRGISKLPDFDHIHPA
jgi:hypothetical protein